MINSTMNVVDSLFVCFGWCLFQFYIHIVNFDSSWSSFIVHPHAHTHPIILASNKQKMLAFFSCLFVCMVHFHFSVSHFIIFRVFVFVVHFLALAVWLCLNELRYTHTYIRIKWIETKFSFSFLFFFVRFCFYSFLFFFLFISNVLNSCFSILD